MKVFFMSVFFVFVCTSACYSDAVFDALITAMSDGTTTAEIQSLKKQYGGIIVSGNGYVQDVTLQGYTVYVSVCINEQNIGKVITPDVKIEVRENNINYNLARGLVRGQRISFTGAFKNIIFGSIYLGGKTTISPQ